MQSKPRYSKAHIERMRNGLLRSWQPGGTHYEKMKGRPADADTVRKRALYDRKGTVAATLQVNGQTFTIRHSRNRTDQYDVEGYNSIACGGRVKVGLYLGSLLP